MQRSDQSATVARWTDQAVAAAAEIGAAKFARIEEWLDAMGGDDTPLAMAAGRTVELEQVVMDPAEDELNRNAVLLALLEGRADVADREELVSQ